ncbi:nuclear pore complex protein Nup160 [Patella vulgata]|uniref:nuclear pore complex protein Nup160 n=1 Tax=Patella vulgata TaxID=6465 RepID=UPI0024A7D9D5|nr:nuclear pore complex protein Nup160 [Patella vulgata]
MAERLSGLFSEVCLSTCSPTRWKEIVVNTGASTSTLQDIKVGESCGGYTYEASGSTDTSVRNRFIYWRSHDDILELVEESLDVNLSGNYVRYRFHSTPILDGITVHEIDNHVVILVATVASVHRLVFPHPDKINKQDSCFLTNAPSPSIFYDVSFVNTTDSRNMFLLNPSSTITTHLTTAATYVDSNGEALFCLSAETGGTILVKMPPLGVQGVVLQNDMCQSSMMKKLWSGWVPTIIRGKQISPVTPYNMVIHTLRGESQIYTVCHDHHLRMWSTKTRECVLTRNLLDWIPNSSSSTATIGSSGHKIKRFYSANVTAMRLCIHLNFTDKNCFVLVEPTYENGKFHFHHITTVFAPHEDLVDYTISCDTLFTLWTSTTGESTARVYLLTGDTEQWIDVILQPPETTDVCLPSYIDPRDFFLGKIFYPGYFALKDILKALNVYRRSVDSSIQIDSVNINIVDLKEEVTNAVETEIRNCAMDYEIQEDEYCQLQLDQWSKFYSCCLQYKEVGSKIKGIFSDNVTGLVSLVKKESLSFLRVCDRLEEVNHLSDQQLPYLDIDVQDEDEAWSLHQDVKRLCDCIGRVDNEISSEHAQQFQSRLLLLDNPQELADHLVDLVYFTEDGRLSTTNCQLLGLHIQEINNITVAMEILIRLLDLNQAETDGHILMEESGIDAEKQSICSRLFHSQTGVAILLKCLQQYSSNRLTFTRNFILLSDLLMKFSQQHQYGVDFDTAMHIRTSLIPELAMLIKNYMVLDQFSHVVATPTQNNALEFNLRQLSILEIADSSGLSPNKGSGNSTLFEIFLDGVGGSYSRSLLGQSSLVNVETPSIWIDLLLPLSVLQARLLWPMSEEFVFAEFLVGSCQYLWLQEYIRQTDSWCNKNVSARQFLLGLAYLHFDEPSKAVDCFVRAGSGVTSDEFLSQKLLQVDEESTESSLEILFYLKVIRQFEEFGFPDVVIRLADIAITIADDKDPNLPTLWSKKFKYHLELNHNEEAYSAMIGNPEPSRRKDCLRQLLIVLCERGDLQTLVDFPFVDLNEEVVNILESRARSVDLTTHNYYNLLYSYHVDRNNYRKAGCIMYEHGMRLGREVPGLKGIQRQAQCYLATLNALRLGKPEYAWIVKPVTNTRLDIGESLSTTKHDLEGEEKNHTEKKVEILEVSDIEKEYMLVDARLRLIRKTEDPTLMSGPTPRAEEMVGHLVNAGFFDRAIIVCRRFDIPLNSVFENLALRCVNLAQTCDNFSLEKDPSSEAWDWLKENYSATGAPCREASATDQAWWLLQYYLECYETGNGKYHRCVAERLLAHGFPLPTWFLNSYRILNTSELLRLYINYDLLEDAGCLVLEYVEAMMESMSGTDSLRYNLKGCVHHKTGMTWLPYTSIDQLLHALQTQQDWTYRKLYEDLREKMSTYMDKVDWLSQEIQVT